MKAVRTTCAYCGVGCGIVAEVRGSRAVAIRGDVAHPANFGKLCSKGTHLGETVSLERRLLAPMLGEQQVGWDAALDEVAARLRRTIAEHGPDSVAFYVSGQLLTEDYYVANKLMKGFIGSGNIDTNSRLCMASAVAAHNRAFGEDVVPCSYDDFDEADLIVLVGSNTAWCHPVIWQRIEAARAARGTKVVVVDPRRTETASGADLYVAVAPDGDVALFNALLSEMAARGLAEAGPVAQGEHGVTPDVFAALCDLVAAHPRMISAFSMGANQSVSGTDKGNSIINLHIAMGRINRDGAGPFSITGQPNAMGGREVGGLANMLACHLGFSEAERADVSAFWGTERLCTGPGLKAVDMFRAIHDGRIRFLWVMATNPAVSMPDAGFVREALARCETVVVSDAIADTDTARFAHIRLPALAWGEKDGTVTNSERRVSRQRALFPAPGQARADWWIMAEVAKRLGHGAAFAFDRPAAIWREYAAMTALAVQHGKVLDLTGQAQLDDAEYEAMAPFQWGARHPLAGRKLALFDVVPQAIEGGDPAFPLNLNTGRYRDQWHTMTRTGLSPTLSRHRREPLVEVHPIDAEAFGLAEGGFARIATAAGEATFRVMVTADQRPGELFVPMHWSDAMAGEGRANRLPAQRVDPISGQPGFKRTPAKISALQPAWRAFLVTTADTTAPAPADLMWWSRTRVGSGWLFELAGSDACAASNTIEHLLPPGERLEAGDAARGMSRIAVRGADGTLAAAVFLTRTGTLPPRDWIAEQLGRADASAAQWLAARTGIAGPDRGPVVCLCHDVRAAEIIAAAAAGKSTRAGSNCGSCRPAIARLLALSTESRLEAAE